jgi:hypothetical protein
MRTGSKLNNRTNLFALYVDVEYYYDLGDYYRCLDYATRLVAIAKICQDSSDAVCVMMVSDITQVVQHGR